MKKLIMTLLCGGMLAAASTSNAQVLFTESFDGATGFATQGWTLIDADGGTINAGVTPIFGSTASWVINADLNDNTDSVAMCTSWLDPVTATDDWMITPMIAGVTAATTLDWEETATDPAYPDGYEVYVCSSIAGATPVTTDFTAGTGVQVFSTPAATGGAWANQSVSLAAFAGGNVWVAYRNNSTDMYILQIDNVFVGVAAAADDLAVDSLAAEYTSIPLPQAASMSLDAYCSNPGTTNITDAIVTCNVYLNGGFVTSSASAATPINSGASAMLNAGTYTPLTTGAYQYEYIISTATGTDVDAANDTVSYFFVVDDNYFARDNSNIVIALGVGAGTYTNLGNIYDLTTPAIMDSVLFFRNGVIGDSTKIEVWSVVAGTPTTMIGESAWHIFSTADSSSTGAVYILPVTDLSAQPLTLAAGSYYVGVSEAFSNANMGLGMTDGIFTYNTTWGSIAGTFGTLESFGFPNTAVVRPRFVPSCSPATFASTTVDAGCGASNGSATANQTNGVAPFAYLWDDLGAQTTVTATGLPAGIYIVTVTDANGCIGMDTLNVLNSGAPTGTGTATNAGCGASDGTATATVTGGNTPYTFLWDDAGSQTTATATGLPAGTYTCTIVDNVGCVLVLSVTVVNPAAPTGTATSTDAGCGATDGTATATPTGGTAPYTYAWDDGASQVTATATGLAAGSYNCTVTDASGCSVVLTVTVANPAAPAGTTTVDASPTCNGDSDGSATATASGGAAPYTYLWDDAAAQTTATATGLPAGTYNCTITDANGCSVSVSVTVNEPAVLGATGTDGMDGTVTANATGGTAPFTYSWDDAGAQTTATATGLSAGTYTCTITDANGCTTTVSVTTTVGFGDITSLMNVTAYPNPANANLTVAYSFDVSENLTVRLMNNVGQQVQIATAQDVVSGQIELNLSNVAAGLYMLEVSTEEGRIVKPIVVSH